MTEETYPGQQEKETGPRQRRSCGWGCAIIAAAVIGAMLGSLIAASLVPWAFGIPPWRLLDREFIERTLEGRDGGGVVLRPSTVSTDAVVAVAAKVSPSVVFISTRQVEQDMFGESQVLEGQGSGVIYRQDGYIVTNNHVVAGADRIFVTIGSAQPIQGRVVGRDVQSDLAVVKVDRTGLTVADFGDSDELQVGELAVAVGAPFGLERTVTQGVISALNRNTTAPLDGQIVAYANLIQTDAAINPGNSGGALANAAGEVVGINTLIRSQTGVSAGVGFAIPTNTVLRVARQLAAGREVRHAYIGIFPASVTPGGPGETEGVTQGAVVARIVPDGPADKAGIRQGDVIIRIDGNQIETVDDLFAIVRDHEPGDKVNIVYVRDGRRNETTVTLAERPQASPQGGQTR